MFDQRQPDDDLEGGSTMIRSTIHVHAIDTLSQEEGQDMPRRAGLQRGFLKAEHGSWVGYWNERVWDPGRGKSRWIKRCVVNIADELRELFVALHAAHPSSGLVNRTTSLARSTWRRAPVFE